MPTALSELKKEISQQIGSVLFKNQLWLLTTDCLFLNIYSIYRRNIFPVRHSIMFLGGIFCAFSVLCKAGASSGKFLVKVSFYDTFLVDAQTFLHSCNPLSADMQTEDLHFSLHSNFTSQTVRCSILPLKGLFLLIP